MSIQPFNPAGEIANPAVLPTSAGTIQLAEWAAELGAAHQLGTALCKTAFVPKDFVGKPEAAAAAILTGKSVGLDPMNALANIFVVHGRPAMYARTMVALVMAQGHEIVRTEATNESVTISARRKGQERWSDFTWSIQRASQAGYTSNAKYKTDPIAMLTAKAQAEACRVIAPDVLAGMPYSAEEMELEDMGETTQPAEAPAKTRKLTRKPATKNPDPAPTTVAEPVADESTGEMQDDGPAAVLETDWDAELAQTEGDRDALISLWNRAVAEGAPAEVVDRITEAGSKTIQQ
ncbi:hypothetical protein [Glutamicibacter sp. M10]|uniref:hypothetical protein n=1 Tax=Glutamicibacter sp. M10 TaxID=3023076 RepID=UPI0021CAC738|nr:hypothetical protein [Glutamicibacter sp. M10]UXN30978.1 hypothetical protein N6V40_11150 [Glutamicibacter sp. M10]